MPFLVKPADFCTEGEKVRFMSQRLWYYKSKEKKMP